MVRDKNFTNDATCFSYGGIFKFTAKTDSERVLKTGQHFSGKGTDRSILVTFCLFLILECPEQGLQSR